MKRMLKWGSLRKLTPLSNNYGYDRGTPIDRYYIEKFLKKNKADINGNVLEIKDRNYTKRFGGLRVNNSDVLDIDRRNRYANIIADLRDLNELYQKYDCIILTQTLHWIDDYNAVLKNLYGMLKRKGVLLCTFPSVSRIDPHVGVEGDFWRFTTASAQYIFTKYFSNNNLQIQAFGNCFTNICFIEGVSCEEISIKELNYYDKYFPLIISVRAMK